MSVLFNDDYSEETSLFDEKIKKLIELIENSRKMTVFTGAGVSTLSGIPDFRGPHGVYSDPWMGMDVEQIISMSFFRKKPAVFYKWAKDVWYRLDDYEPNIVHAVIAKLEKKGYINGVYTQNIDMLHQKAGSTNVYEVHGSPQYHYCTVCNEQYDYKDIAPLVLKEELPVCSKCGGVIKPKIVFYEEALPSEILRKAFRDFSETDLCLIAGSSLTVQPAASFPEIARQNGAKVVIVNARETYQDIDAYLHFNDLKQTFEALDKWLGEK